MTIHRCILLDLESTPGLREAVEAALLHLPECGAERCSGTQLPAHAADALIMLLSGGDAEGLAQRVRDIRSRHPACAIVVVGEDLDAGQLSRLLAAGACDFLATPFGQAEFAIRLRKALGILPDDAVPTAPAPRHPRLRGFIGESPVFMRQVERLPTFAACGARVLIHGETGTGKELFAQAIHYLSPRAAGPWVAVNCGAIPTELVEDELFGHVKGAYTTAHASRRGLVEEADGGTLFLDDIDCLPLAAQAKLLRFLQEREYRPVGSSALRRADVRVIAASNQNLSALAARGAFRQDLYFRLNVLALQLPPLRERTEDIAALALHFARQAAREFGRGISALAPSALRRLVAHGWPGNVRELQHVIERAVLLSAGPTLQEADIDVDVPIARSEVPQSLQAAKARLVENFERGFIERLLIEHGGNVTHAAGAAGKHRRAFFELMRKYRIEPAQFRAQR